MRTGSGAGGGGAGTTGAAGSLLSAVTPASTVMGSVLAALAELLGGGVLELQPARNASTTGKADLFIMG
jgi:hypothetical protein